MPETHELTELQISILRLMWTRGEVSVAEVWEARPWRNAAVLKGHIKSVTAAAFLNDPSHVVTASEDGTVKL